MGGSEQHLTVGEFERGIARFERVVEARFDRVESKLDAHTDQIATLKATQRADKRQNAKRVAGWSAVVTSGLVAGFEAVRRLLSGG